MRSGAPDEVMSSVYAWSTSIQAWSPTGELLAASVPIEDGSSLSWDVSQRGVPEQARLVVPRYSVKDGHRFDWMPDRDEHPLSEIGNTLSVSVIVRSVVTGQEWVTPLARLLVESTDLDEAGHVQVAAVGMLQLAADDKLIVPQSPDADSTLMSEAARLLPGSLALAEGTGVPDRPCQPGTQWAGPRLDVLYDIADSLPARLRPDEDGNVVMLLPKLDEQPDVVAVYRDGEPRRGPAVDGVPADMPTLISAPRGRTRAGVVNSITVTSQVVENGIPVEYVVVEQTTGRFAVGTYGRKSEAWTSEQVANRDEAEAAGRKQLADRLRRALTMQVSVAPDPRREVDDAVEVVRDGVRRTGYVLAQTLDLAGTQPMTMTVGITAERGAS